MDWVVRERFIHGFTADELQRSDDPLHNRPCKLDGMDRKSLLKLREEQERFFGGRSAEELKCYVLKHVWPKKWIEYSIEDDKVVFRWRIEPTEDIRDPRSNPGS